MFFHSNQNNLEMSNYSNANNSSNSSNSNKPEISKKSPIPNKSKISDKQKVLNNSSNFNKSKVLNKPLNSNKSEISQKSQNSNKSEIYNKSPNKYSNSSNSNKPKIPNKLEISDKPNDKSPNSNNPEIVKKSPNKSPAQKSPISVRYSFVPLTTEELEKCDFLLIHDKIRKDEDIKIIVEVKTIMWNLLKKLKPSLACSLNLKVKTFNDLRELFVFYFKAIAYVNSKNLTYTRKYIDEKPIFSKEKAKEMMNDPEVIELFKQTSVIDDVMKAAKMTTENKKHLIFVAFDEYNCSIRYLSVDVRDIFIRIGLKPHVEEYSKILEWKNLKHDLTEVIDPPFKFIDCTVANELNDPSFKHLATITRSTFNVVKDGTSILAPSFNTDNPAFNRYFKNFVKFRYSGRKSVDDSHIFMFIPTSSGLFTPIYIITKDTTVPAWKDINMKINKESPLIKAIMADDMAKNIDVDEIKFITLPIW